MKILAIALTLASPLAIISCSKNKEAETYEISAPLEQIDHSHAAFSEILEEHVKDERVDYAALKGDPAALDSYLETLAAVPRDAFEKWDENQQMAFLINLYNAATLELIIDHYPLESIKDIGNLFKGPWKQEVVRLFGKIETLDHVEHDLLRPDYDDPRVHFAVNCASIGCPALRAEAFQASALDSQLDEQGRLFLGDDSKNRLDDENDILYLSPIFDWFEDDFTSHSGSIAKFVAPYFPADERKVILESEPEIEYTEYDWALNDR